MFKLSKRYAWFSVVCVLLCASILSALYSHFQVVNLKKIGERDSVALTQSFANTLGAELVEWVAQAASMPADEIKLHTQTQSLMAKAKRQMRGTDVSKIKIYALNGKTVFSSEINQIGEDKSQNAGYQRARSGKVATELTHRDSFSAFEQVLMNRNLLATYLPVRDPQTAEVAVVFELYNDVTELLEEMEQTGRRLMGAVVLILAAVFGVMYAVVRHADRSLRGQYERLESSLQALSSSHDDLEQKFAESSAQLEKTKAGLAAAWATAHQSNLDGSELLSRVASTIREPTEKIAASSRQLAESRLDSIQRGQLSSIQGNAELLRNSVMRLLERANTQRVQAPPKPSVPVLDLDQR